MAGVVVSVLVPVLNEAKGLREIVAAMRAQRLDGELELLFVDGGSDDGTRDILAELAAGDPRIRVLDNPRRLIAPALNIGLAAARGEFVARMDAHTLYPPDYLQRGIERLRRGDGAGGAGAQLPSRDGGAGGAPGGEPRRGAVVAPRRAGARVAARRRRGVVPRRDRG